MGKLCLPTWSVRSYRRILTSTPPLWGACLLSDTLHNAHGGSLLCREKADKLSARCENFAQYGLNGRHSSRTSYPPTEVLISKHLREHLMFLEVLYNYEPIRLVNLDT